MMYTREENFDEKMKRLTSGKDKEKSREKSKEKSIEKSKEISKEKSKEKIKEKKEFKEDSNKTITKKHCGRSRVSVAYVGCPLCCLAGSQRKNHFGNYIHIRTKSLSERSKCKIEKKNILIKNEHERVIKETNEKVINLYTNQINEKINKFKVNNLKEIYETIYNNCYKITDVENIERFGLSTHLKEKLILPTCYIIKERDLEFTFQNFCIISKEILKFLI